GDKKDARDLAGFQLNIAASTAATLVGQGKESGKKRGKSYDPSSVRLPNSKEEAQMNDAATASY
ncbi:hypothetical protein BO71DRAFT_458718, partial [Aspergillus ellipticus CBS 707.79]